MATLAEKLFEALRAAGLAPAAPGAGQDDSRERRVASRRHAILSFAPATRGGGSRAWRRLQDREHYPPIRLKSRPTIVDGKWKS